MKYFIDTEFLEGPQKEKFPISLFRKQTPNTIDLISIGIIAEDGREYYAISKDFNLEEAWNRFDINLVKVGEKKYRQKVYWLRENVLKPIFMELFKNYELTNDIYSNKQVNAFVKTVDSGALDHLFCFTSLKSLLSLYGKTNKQIAEEVKEFCDFWNTLNSGRSLQNHPIEFYAYYADYDWVVFCWLFGKMIDLPKEFPMYCRDLKQMMDDKYYSIGTQKLPKNGWIELLKQHSSYPQQTDEHNALADARWNKKLYEFLTKL